MHSIKRVLVEKKRGYDVDAKSLKADLRENLQIKSIDDVRILVRYDIDRISEETYQKSLHTIFSEPPVDSLYEETFPSQSSDKVFAIEYLPGQYDQRADSAEQCIKLIDPEANPIVRNAKLIVLSGSISDEEYIKIKNYCINPVDSREADLIKPESLELDYSVPNKVMRINGFIEMSQDAIEALWQELGLAMNQADLLFVQDYFKNEEKRDPSITEIRALDTYWSDHCRHTTFLTKITDISIENGLYNEPVKAAYEAYLSDRKTVYGDKEASRNICLMDIALLAMKKLRKEGKLEDLEVSDEINACSIVVEADIFLDGTAKKEDWLVMFKNETHNHPTEIEPFGGAATCLGGAIRDPLSGRSYVYQAMRVTGAGDPTVSVKDTLPNKLSQRKIVTGAASGYSSYGNQIGLATGLVKEIYHPNYVAKRLEIGAVIAANKKENVYRGKAEAGDIIVLLGGQTGRDGCGGATGSSKEHTEESLHTCGAEVQKGNPPTERKLQRLFRNADVSKKIKVCNDFGAGGVSVAIGELADGLIIDLNAVPKKYAGLDGTEIAISESQERMAVVLDPKDVDWFIQQADQENLEATVVAVVTEEKRLVMNWNDDEIVNVSRDFLGTNGATAEAKATILPPSEEDYFTSVSAQRNKPVKEQWLELINDLNVCSQKGLVERFDSTIGAGSVLMPYGGKYQTAETETMVAKLPLLEGDTTTGTIMSHGYNPYLMSWSPFHGSVYAVVESVAKIVATGGDYKGIRFTFQEYFKKLGQDATRWGEPLSALLGAYSIQRSLELASIGGKDSMSGTYKDIDVPPTLVSFAVDVVDVNKVISPEFKQSGNSLVLVSLAKDSHLLPEIDALKANYTRIHELINQGVIVSARSIGFGGLAEAVTKMAFGNKLGAKLVDLSNKTLFVPDYGSIICEINSESSMTELFGTLNVTFIGNVVDEPSISCGDIVIALDEAQKVWEEKLEKVFKTRTEETTESIQVPLWNEKNIYICKNKVAKPKVFIPVFPGTNCEYDTIRQFREAGAEVLTTVLKNTKPHHIEESLREMTDMIKQSQMIMVSGGFSAGDEPEGSGKFIATVFRNEMMKNAVNEMLHQRDGLMLGICNGFQALIKLGLVPEGGIVDLSEHSPTLTYNTIGRHISNIAQTKVISNKSPWLKYTQVGEVFAIPVSHGEGRFIASEEVIKQLSANGQIATQYVDLAGNPTMDITFNANGSFYAIEGITSADGRVLGKMGHSERIGTNVHKNIQGKKDQQLFRAGVEYFL